MDKDMIYSLRKRHFRIWLLLAIGLPILFYISLNGIPVNFPVSDFEEPIARAYDQLIVEEKRDRVEVRYFRDTHLPGRLIEIEVVQPLSHPGVMAYASTDAQSKGVRIGLVESTGTYRFSLPRDLLPNQYLLITLFDELKKTEVERFELTF
jgi:hypothetical protein